MSVSTVGGSGDAGSRDLPPAPAPGGHRLSPKLLAYLMGPAAFVAILILMHLGYIARESAWVWLGVFVAIPLANVIVDRLYDTRPSAVTLNLRVMSQIAAVTAVIFLSGWGPVLWGAYAFVALETISVVGSRTWRLVALWCVVGLALGEICLWRGWVPSELSLPRSTALIVMGIFVVLFVIRMAGATMEQKEDAELAVRMSEDRFRSLIQNSSDVTLIIDADGVLQFLSPAVEELLGYQPEELVGTGATELVHEADRDRVEYRLGPDFQASAGSDAGMAALEFAMGTKSGVTRYVEAVISNQLDRPSVGGYVANLRDVTERKKFEELLSHRALHDPLTGLANRQLILDRAEQMLVRARRCGDPVAAYFVDLDNFKDANDSLGHEAGDHLLQAVANRLVGLLRVSDTVGRLGGDEFVVLAEGMSLASGPQAIAERIRQVLKPPFYVDGFKDVPISVSASIGIAAGDRESAQDLLRDADIALYRAKGQGRDQAIEFEAEMQVATNDRLALRNELDVAFQRQEFFLLYQPIFELDSMRIQGVEALLRWNHPTQGTILPDRFIPVLEESGDIVKVGRWVLEEACGQLAKWHADGQDVSVSVNASMRQLESDTFVDDVRSALARHALPPALLTIEITETVLMKDVQATVVRLTRLKALGVKIAIDDFGTGYSSMAYLRQFPVDILKIDRTFISEMNGSLDGAALVHTLIELGRALGLVTLAEGIEEAVQIDGLRTERCDHGQGFLFARPTTSSEIQKMLDTARDHDSVQVPTSGSSVAPA
ncbi:MAG TPA: EAL domain-containing protein [Acidimicrobiales bacterium]